MGGCGTGSSVCQALGETRTLEVLLSWVGAVEGSSDPFKLLLFSEPQLPLLQNGIVIPTLQGCNAE